TPAGFELNSPRVAGRIADFLRERLQNYRPRVTVVPARRRGTPYSPDDPALAQAVLQADVIFLGPGSPTYAVRQLRDSAVWYAVVARHRLGAGLVLASAATIAAGALALPVYEIYKVGEDPHWKPGLDLFAAFGLSLVFVPHWNNTDGGQELDTSRCFMGRERFEWLRRSLPPEVTVVGIDEQTALILDLAAGHGEVVGSGQVTVLRGDEEHVVARGRPFDLALLGPLRLPEPSAGLPAAVWQAALEVAQQAAEPSPPPIPAPVQALLEQRQAARQRRDWAQADALRRQIEALGWEVQDTPDGPRLQLRARRSEAAVRPAQQDGS
ncbi:MAG: hypothetical protein NZ528_13295, partial [Caldilineales bacterium]|nr:hypothetical protein [Caldilineales bacterium]